MDNKLITHPLAAIRHERGWTLQDVANITAGGDRHMSAWRQKVYRWERWGVRPELVAQYALAEELEVTHAVVDEHPWPGWLLYAQGAGALEYPWTPEFAMSALADVQGAHSDRRGFLILTGLGLLANLAPAWAEPWRLVPSDKITAAAEGGRVDAEIVRAIERRLVELWSMDDAIGGGRCAELADADLRLVKELLQRGHHTEPIRRRLYSAAAGLCRSAGWGCFDADRHAAAGRYWSAGMRAAHLAGDGAEAAYLLSNMALQQNFAGNGRTAIGMLDGAREIIGQDGAHAVHAMLDAWQVRSHAVLGEKEQASRLLGQADERWDQRNPESDPDWVYWMRRPSETIEVNMAMVTIGKAAETETRLHRWIAEDGQRYSRDTAFALTVIARAQLEAGQLDVALETARAAMAAHGDVESGRIADELSNFTERLPASEPAAQEFRDEIAQLEAPNDDHSANLRRDHP